MTRPLLLSDRLSPSVETWLANRPSARLVAADPAVSIERLGATMADYAKQMDMDDANKEWRAKGARLAERTERMLDDAGRDRLALFDALGPYEVVKATCDDHAQMVRERDAEAWVSVEERLPEVGVRVLAWDGFGFSAYITGGGGWNVRNRITHWKPIVPPVPR